MFHFIEELWKGQKYLSNSYDFVIPESLFFKEKTITWYFSSKKQRNQILKKREENSTIKHVIEFFQIGDLVNDLDKSKSGYTFRSTSTQQNHRLVATVYKMNLQVSNVVNVRHLQLKELAIMIQDYQVYPHLYNDVCLTQYIEPDPELGSHYFKVHLMTKFQTIEIQRSEKPQTFELQEEELENLPVNDKKEERLTLISRSIVNIINKSQFKLGQVQDLTLYFKYYQSSYFFIACKQIEFNGLQGNLKFTIEFQESRDFLYNQALYNEFQKAMHNQLIQQDKKCKLLKISCACCKTIVLKGETFQILSNKIWQIQIARQLHHLQKTPFNSISEQNYKFVEICQLCYDEFLKSCEKDYKVPQDQKILPPPQNYQIVDNPVSRKSSLSTEQKRIRAKSYTVDTKLSEIDLQSEYSKSRSNSRQNKYEITTNIQSEKQNRPYFPIAEIFETLPIKMNQTIYDTNKQNQTMTFNKKPPLSKINQTQLKPIRIQSSINHSTQQTSGLIQFGSLELMYRRSQRNSSGNVKNNTFKASQSKNIKNKIRSLSAINQDGGMSTDASSKQLDYLVKQQLNEFVYQQVEEEQQ